LLFAVSIPGIVKRGSGSPVLSVFIALAVVIFGMVSFIANAGLIAKTSSLTHVIVLLVLVGIAGLVRSSEAGKSVA